jgi:hypothetical protein
MSTDQGPTSVQSDKQSPPSEDSIRAIRGFIVALRSAAALGKQASALLAREAEAGKERSLLEPELAAELMLSLVQAADVRDDIQACFRTLWELGKLLGGTAWRETFTSALKQQGAAVTNGCGCPVCVAVAVAKAAGGTVEVESG